MGLGSLRCPTRLVASCRARTRTCGARTLCEAYAEHRRWTLGIRELPRPLVGGGGCASDTTDAATNPGLLTLTAPLGEQFFLRGEQRPERTADERRTSSCGVSL